MTWWRTASGIRDRQQIEAPRYGEDLWKSNLLEAAGSVRSGNRAFAVIVFATDPSSVPWSDVHGATGVAASSAGMHREME